MKSAYPDLTPGILEDKIRQAEAILKSGDL